MAHFWVSFALVVVMVMVMVMAAFGMLSTGGDAMMLLNVPAFIIVGAFPFLAASTAFDFRNMAAALSAATGKSTGKGELECALTFFGAFAKTVWLAMLIATVTSGINIFFNLDDRAAIGPNVALALAAQLYDGIIRMAVALPFTVILRKHLG